MKLDSTSPQTENNSYRMPGFFKRFACGVYDGLLIFGLLVIAATLGTTLNVIFTGQLTITQSGWIHWLFQLYMLLVAMSYCLYFWTGGRQTLGMRAWRLHLISFNQNSPNWIAAIVRFVMISLSLALASVTAWYYFTDQLLNPLMWFCVLPLLLAYIDMFRTETGLTWYDYVSRTRLVIR
jgi:uncharacterized RDD family membrane protein YckC